MRWDFCCHVCKWLTFLFEKTFDFLSDFGVIKIIHNKYIYKKFEMPFKAKMLIKQNNCANKTEGTMFLSSKVTGY